MEEYKSNSYKSKERQQSEKKVEKVVTGLAKTRKKTEVQRLRDIFISEDISNVKGYILMDVLIPRIRDTFVDIIKNSVDMIFYGGDAPSRKSSSPTAKISYNRYYSSSSDRRDPRREIVRNGFDYDDIIFESRGDAEAVLTAMEDIIDQYGVVSVGDFYDLANVSTTNYAINKYGWTDLRVAEPVRLRDGSYILKLPRALPLN